MHQSRFGQITIHHVPYSEHSTFDELRQFVALMAHSGCRRVISTVHVAPAKAKETAAMFADLLTSSGGGSGAR